MKLLAFCTKVMVLTISMIVIFAIMIKVEAALL